MEKIEGQIIEILTPHSSGLLGSVIKSMVAQATKEEVQSVLDKMCTDGKLYSRPRPLAPGELPDSDMIYSL